MSRARSSVSEATKSTSIISLDRSASWRGRMAGIPRSWPSIGCRRCKRHLRRWNGPVTFMHGIRSEPRVTAEGFDPPLPFQENLSMATNIRGADIVVKALERAGHTTIFTLSGNHIMSLFDAALDSKLNLLHVRHEAASVHMADAYGRLTGKPGIAWVTGGPGHANAVGALFTAQGQESPMVLLSGHTETDQLGRGGFQELRQVEMAGRSPRRPGWRPTPRPSAWTSPGPSASPWAAVLGLCISACRQTCWTRPCRKALLSGPRMEDFVDRLVGLSDAAAEAVVQLSASQAAFAGRRALTRQSPWTSVAARSKPFWAFRPASWKAPAVSMMRHSARSPRSRAAPT